MSWSNVSLIVKRKDCPINFAASGAAQYFKVLITHKKVANSANHARSDYPASRGYIFAVWAGEQKVASADNRSNPSRNLDE